jgi:hypothetical protein
MKFNFYFLFAFITLALPLGVFAADSNFVPLVGIPGLTDVMNITDEGGLNQYINALYRLSISIAALLAVIKIVAAGAKYMLTDIVPAKSEAKSDIQGALIGLLIVIGAIIILNTVNSDLTNLKLSLPDQQITQGEKIQDKIRRQLQSMEERAEEMGSRKKTWMCQEKVGGIGEDFERLHGESGYDACKRICKDTYKGQFVDEWGSENSCHYIESVAAKCAPNSDYTCCEVIHKADWNSETKKCSGVAESLEVQKAACYRKGYEWNDSGDFCSVKKCNINSDLKCCVGTGGNKIEGGKCTTESAVDQEEEQDKQDCEARTDTIWDDATKTCVVTDEEIIIPGTEFDIPPYVADLDPNIPSELAQINLACKDGGPNFRYSSKLNKCAEFKQ